MINHFVQKYQEVLVGFVVGMFLAAVIIGLIG